MHERGVGEERLAKNEDRDRDQYGGGSVGAAPGQRRCMQIADIEEVEDLRDEANVDNHRARNFESELLIARVAEDAERDHGEPHDRATWKEREVHVVNYVVGAKILKHK